METDRNRWIDDGEFPISILRFLSHQCASFISIALVPIIQTPTPLLDDTYIYYH
jgi:hypothetical protein